MIHVDDCRRLSDLMEAYAKIRRTLPEESEEDITLAFSKIVEQIVIALEGNNNGKGTD